MMTELIAVAAADVPSLVAEIARVVGYIDRVPSAPLADVAYTCSLGKGPVRITVVAGSLAELRARLVSAQGRLAVPTCARIRDKSGTYYFRDHLLGDGRGKLAFVYPGVMSFYPDMLRDLAIEAPECRSAFDELEEAMADDEDFRPSDFIFPPAPYYRHDADIFSSGAYAQALVAVYSAGVGLTRMLQSDGLVPDGVVGIAGGDLAAMMRSGAAGSLRPRTDRVRAIREIYRLVDKAIDHAGLPEIAMLTVILRNDEAEAKLHELLAGFPEGKVQLALDLSPRQKTYAVELGFAETATAAFTAADIRVMRLALNRPFNTPLCRSIVPAILKFAVGWMRETPSVEIYSCGTAGPVPAKLAAARKDTAERWSRPVLFADTIRRMYADGFRVFLEVGPRGLMTTSVSDTLKGLDHAAIAMNSIHRRGMLQAQHAIAQLMALGAEMDISWAYRRRGMHLVDLDSALPPQVRREAEMLLSRRFPRFALVSDEPLRTVGVYQEPRGRGAKVAARLAAVAANDRRQRRFESGAMHPLVADSEEEVLTPGFSVEMRKVFDLADAPFIGDFSIGTSQLSYSDPNLRGLVLLTIPVAAEAMAEVASKLIPGYVLVAIDDLVYRRHAAFSDGRLSVAIKAERIASGNPSLAAVKVLLREERPDSAWIWPDIEATFVLAKEYPEPEPIEYDPLTHPRSVHWSGRDIYPVRVCCGRRLRNISFAESWSESGLDYTVTVPPRIGSVAHAQLPVWVVNPLLLGSVTAGFTLWRSHERFPGAYSFPFRCRRIDFLGPLPQEGSELKCYMRLTGVTPKSQLSDIKVSTGDGVALMRISGWEELCERVNPEYRDLVMQPATSFITRKLGHEFIGNPATEVATAYVTDIPYPVFEKSEELWLKAFSHIVLHERERRDFQGKTGSASRRTEWLFGRIVAKEAVRRYLKEYHQARWSYADVEIIASPMGKPHAIGAWADDLREKLDIAIAHTAQFVVAVAAANARVGVDVESSARDLSEEFTNGVFDRDECDLAIESANGARAVILFWCAKEAVSKALGTGIRYSPKEMKVSGYLADSGTLTIRLLGEWEKAFPQFKGRDIGVTVRTLHDHALAFCFLPSTLFNEE